MVYGSGLENQRGRKFTVGSNPTLSVSEAQSLTGFFIAEVNSSSSCTQAMPVCTLTTVTQPNCRCLVWFRGGLNEDSYWVSGWYGAPSTLGGIRIERSDYVPCRVADWRVLFSEPADMKVGPEIPENAVWKLVPTDPR